MVYFDIENNNMNDDDDNNINVLSNIKNYNEMKSYHVLESNHESNDDRLSYSSFMVICNQFYNSVKGINQITKYVVRLMLEIKEIINLITNEKINIDRLMKQTHRYKNMLTSLKDNSNLNLKEPYKITNKESTSRKRSIFEIIHKDK